jgi:hypothetical protein
MNRTTQSDERRQQADRRRGSYRRETDQQHPERSFQIYGDTNAQAEEHRNNAQNRAAIFNSRPVVHALSEDEIRFILDHS